MNIIFLPFAGGNKNSYQRFFTAAMVPHTLEYSGRGARSRQNLQGDIDLVVEDALIQLTKIIRPGTDYILYGHSMGGLVGYLLCHRLQELKLTMPVKLIVSGRNAPAIIRKKLISDLPDDLFWNEVVSLGGIPEELNEHPGLVEYYISIIKSDFRAVEKYEYKSREKLSIPIDVFFGSEENIDEDIVHWGDETTNSVSYTQLPGGHFFIFDHVDYFKNYFNEQSFSNVEI